MCLNLRRWSHSLLCGCSRAAFTCQGLALIQGGCWGLAGVWTDRPWKRGHHPAIAEIWFLSVGPGLDPPVSACPWQCPGRVSETHSLLKIHPGSQSPVTVLRSPQVPALMNPFDLTSPSSADLPQLLPVLSPPASALLASWPRGTVPRWGWAPLAVGSEGEMSSVPGKKGSSVS